MTAVNDNKALSRFELEAEGGVAFAKYRLAPGMVVITHTEVPRELRGGIASTLVKGALTLIRADDLKVAARCGFVAAYLDKHPEEADRVE
ncbi:GNAT family N-acetyltransferase [Nitrobacter sp. TKz-YC02]|uniref:GNAT family N-acetyltransferase n=1 Tax=Nitrobacter sp. TKz-YC02 TaxID=3398704 RepID=UPI003CEB714F